MNVTPVRHCPACWSTGTPSRRYPATFGRTAFRVSRAAYGSYRTTFSRPAATKR